MSVLAHVFETAGIATVVLAATRSVAERIAPPRALYCEFPLGRPLGRPNDPAFQTDVLRRAFALFDEPTGPVLVDHPEHIETDETPLACSLPPRFDPDLPACVDEARGIRRAYERATARTGTTEVGKTLTAADIPTALGWFHDIANGTDWTTIDFGNGGPMAAAADIRAYYEAAAIELADDIAPAGRAAEAWFFEHTEAGATILAARQQMRAHGAHRNDWFYLAPGHR